jgi:PAS domain S-box-containing protein
MVEMSTNKCFEEWNEKNKHNSADGRYETLFQRVNAAAFLTTLDGKILEANIRSCEILGYGWDDLKVLSLKDVLVSSTDWPNLIDEISARGGLNFESEAVRKEGTRFPIDVSASLFTMDKKPVMLTLIRDITERKKAEEKLKASEEKYQGLFECTTDGMLVLDARGEILDINGRAVELFGFEEEKMIGHNLLGMGLLTPKALSIVVKQFQDLLSNRKSNSEETEIKDKNGKLLNVELTSFFLIRKNNEIDNFVLIIRDISQRKQAEYKLAREHELLQTLMDSIPDSVYFKDEENRFIMVNKAKAAHSNVTAEEMMGKTDFDFLPPDQARKAFEDDEEVMNTGKFIFNKVEKITNNDGTERWVSVTKIPRFDSEGNIIGTMGISRDVTEWKKLEETYKKEKQVEV